MEKENKKTEKIIHISGGVIPFNHEPYCRMCGNIKIKVIQDDKEEKFSGNTGERLFDLLCGDPVCPYSIYTKKTKGRPQD